MRYILGRALFEAGRRPEAIEQLEAALSLQPNHPGAVELLGLIRRPGY
jgi:Flp pilus assembly protein TadD